MILFNLSLKEKFTMLSTNFIISLISWFLCFELCLSGIAPILEEQPRTVFLNKISNFIPSRLNLQCYANVDTYNGKPIEFFWTKYGKPYGNRNDKRLTSSGTGIGLNTTINQLDRVEGNFQCHAKSDAGVASSTVVTAKKIFIEFDKQPPQNHTPIAGEPYNLTCHLKKFFPRPLFLWKKLNSSNVSSASVISDERIIDTEDGTLWFSSVTKDDVSNNTKFVCMVMSPAILDTTIVAEHYIQDLKDNPKPENGKIIPLFISRNVTILTGETAILSCIFGGNPIPKVKWFKDGHRLNYSSNNNVVGFDRGDYERQLFFVKTRLVDQGSYECLAENGLDTPQHYSIYVTVNSLPTFTWKPSQETTVVAGNNVTLYCTMTGNPPPVATWTYNAKPLPKNPRYIMKNNRINTLKIVADLMIYNVQKNETGYYGCQGKNENGVIYAETVLMVSGE